MEFCEKDLKEAREREAILARVIFELDDHLRLDRWPFGRRRRMRKALDRAARIAMEPAAAVKNLRENASFFELPDTKKVRRRKR